MDYSKICIQKTICVGTQKYFLKKVLQNVWKFKKMPYLCNRYPENNLFTLKKLIPIEDLERLPVKAIAFFIIGTLPSSNCMPHNKKMEKIKLKTKFL
jgi:hypothetical protein